MSDNQSVLARFIKLKSAVEKQQQRRDKAKGALDEIKKRLKKEFNVSSLKEAEALLETLNAQMEQMKEELEKKLAEIEEEFGDELE